MGTEPAFIIGLITSAIALAVAFGVPISDAQTAAIKDFALAVSPLIAAAATRFFVSPRASA